MKVNNKTYEYHRIGKLAEQLETAAVDQKIIDRIMKGGEDIKRASGPLKSADWMRQAMVKMDGLLDLNTRRTVREGCACCTGGKRLKISQAIAKDNSTLEARIKAANEAHFVFGHGVTLMENGEIIVRFFPEGQEHYRCACMPQADKPLPISYCFCCGGHAKHHLQIALGRKLDCTVLASALASGGKEPCTFSFQIIDR